MKKYLSILFVLLLTNLFAKEELIVYIPGGYGTWLEKATVAFEKKNNVDVKFVEFDGAATIVSRLILEKKNPKADVVIGLTQSTLVTAKKNNLLTPFKPVNSKNLRKDAQPIDNAYYASLFDYGGLAIIYDSTKLTNPPKSFADITKMKKVLIIQDPRTSTTGQDFLLWTIALYGNKWQDFWKQLKPSIKVVTQDWGEGFDKLLAGEAPLMVSYASNEAYSYEYYGGTKILTLIPKEGGYQQKEGTALVTKKITKKLAKDFIEFTLSNEFQSTVPLNNWMLPAANVKLPKSFDHYKHSSKYVSVSNNDIDKNMEKWLKEWATIMKE